MVERHFEVLMNLHTGVVVHAADTRILFSNRRASQLLGLTDAQMLGKAALDPAWQFVDEQGQRLAPSEYPVSKVIASRLPLKESVFGVHTPQRQAVQWLLVSAFPDFSPSGELLQVVVNFHDISVRKHMELELGASQRFARSVLDSITANVCVLDEHGVIVAVNQAWRDFCAANGGEPGRVHEGANYVAACEAAMQTPSPEARDASILYELLQQVLAGRRDHFEYTYPCHSPQEQRWFLVRAARIRGLAPTRVVALHVNVTALKQMQEQLSRSLDFSNKLIASMNDGFSVLDQDGLALDANPALCRMTGFAREELVGIGAPFPYWPPEEIEHIRSAFVQTLQGRTSDFELTFMKKGGERFPVLVSASPARDATGAVISYTATVKDISERKAFEAELGRFKAIVESTDDAIISCDRAGMVHSWNPGAQRMFGYRADEAIGVALDTLIPVVRNFGDRVAAGSGGDSHGIVRSEALRHCQGGRLAAIATTTSPIRDRHGQRIGAAIVARDVTERRKSEEALRIAAVSFESELGVMVTDVANVILRVNQAFTELTGYSAEEAVGQTPRLLRSGRHEPAFYTAIWQCIAQQGSWQGEIWNRRKNGESFPEWLAIKAVRDEHGTVTHYVGTFSDITQRKAAEEEIRSLAFSDPLTRLPNRRLLMDRLTQAVNGAARRGRRVALLFIDMDNFKLLNDTAGHHNGDLLLQQVAKLLGGCVRDDDTVARLGGDEFVVMLDNLQEDELEAADQARLVGEKILAALDRTYRVGNLDHHATASIGITLLDSQQQSGDELLKRADLAMYEAKAAGRNTFRFFDPRMQAVVLARAALEAELRSAVSREQFVLYYQAQVRDNGQVTGAEALLRWKQPGLGLRLPSEFIGLAEETGLILPVGQWVLNAACGQLAQWARHPETAGLDISVNVSARQFHQPGFVAQVVDALAQASANPRRLVLELTESLLVVDVASVAAKMSALKALGVSFALDDFGTGYSSLASLKQLPLDKLKIDQQFVRDILVDPHDAAIARMIITLASSLGVSVLAEGVETEAQRVFLRGLGCPEYQGYLFSRPVPIGEFAALIAGEGPWPRYASEPT